jgi:serine/threonine-protein kinase
MVSKIMMLSRFLWICPFLSFITGYLLIGFLSGSTTVVTPSVVGQQLDKAALWLSQKNLNLRIVGHKDEADLPEGTIVSQTPSAGTAIKERQSLYLVIARKPAPLQVPNLRNKMADEATKIIETQSLQPKVVALPADIATPQCIAQYPAPEMASLDQSVIVYTIQNQKPMIMPNLRKKSVEDVLSFLHLHGINAEILHTQPTLAGHQCTHCIITDQRPLSGSLIILNPHKPLTIQLQVITH